MDNLANLWAEGWAAALLRGAGMTVLIAVAALIIGLALGLGLALIKWARLPVLHFAVNAYTLLIRGVPEILVIYVFFFASDDFMQIMGAAFGYQNPFVSLLPLLAVILAVGLIASSYAVETIRGALNAVPRGLIEAGAALGLTARQRFRFCILPPALRLVLPGINNIWQNTVKDTALVALVSITELLYRAQLGANATGQPFLFYSAALALYLLITLASQSLFRLVERRLAAIDGGRNA